jgi:hypothetical protein
MISHLSFLSWSLITPARLEFAQTRDIGRRVNETGHVRESFAELSVLMASYTFLVVLKIHSLRPGRSNGTEGRRCRGYS